MEMTQEIKIRVMPFIINDASVSNAERIGKDVIKFNENYSARNISIHSYNIIDDKLIIYVTGNIGNVIDQFIIMLAGITPVNSEYHYQTVNRAKKHVRTLSDIDAIEMLKNKQLSEYPELSNDLTCAFS